MNETDFSAIFRVEAEELLETLEQALLDLEGASGDNTLINTAFRALHTLKGSGGMFGFTEVAAFTHEFETAFDHVRKGRVAPSRDLIKLALAAMDHIRALVEAPAHADTATGHGILARLHNLLKMPEEAAPKIEPAPLGAPADDAPSVPPAATNLWRIQFSFARDVLINGTNPLLLLGELSDLGQATITALTEDIPPLDEIQPDDCYVGWEVILATDQSRSSIEDVFIFVIDEMTLSIEAITPGAILPPAAAPSRESLAQPVPSGSDGAAPAVAVPEISSAAVETRVPAKRSETPTAPRAAEPKNHHREAEHNREAAKSNNSVRVPVERLDELMNRVGEMVIAQARLSQLAAGSRDPALQAVSEEIERLANELRDTTMGIRMVPIGSLFGRFRRLIHDLSGELGKDIELVTAGEDTELDKTVAEKLADPLIHIIRNALDHGIELPEQRRAAGKSASGRIQLVARHAGAEVLISITDDGKGLDPQRIRAKAEEQGLLAADANPTEAELFQYIFHPGFSTAREITALSGRGVGMDVVKRTLEALRGSIDIASHLGTGTTVTLRLPLTLAIIDGLLVRIGKARYVIPLAVVEECVELSTEEDNRSKGRQFLNIRGDLIPFLRMRELFNTSAGEPYQKIIIVSVGDRRIGLVVDQVIGNHQTVIKSLSKLHADVDTFSGATILGDGTVALILDIVRLIEYGQTHEERLKAS